ncbi:MAG: T9SS type A sorting domain-containing protein [Flavobacteriales bacterium]|nr:T9SS type A sorting domain-containing protein [Flavobacteriales bacterium]
MTGRDQQGCNDIFIINFHKENPTIINSTDNSTSEFVTIEKSTVGIEDVSAVSGFRFGPNPITDNAIFELNLRESKEDVAFEIHNTVGQLVYSDAMNLSSGKNIYNLNASGLTSGIYLASFRDASGLLVQERIVVQ